MAQYRQVGNPQLDRIVAEALEGLRSFSSPKALAKNLRIMGV
jgi:hypothetical protein